MSDNKTTVIMLTVINNPFDPRDHTRSTPEWKSGATVGSYVPAPYTEVVVSLNGEIVPDDSLFETQVCEGDSVVICPVPQGGGGKKAILRIVAMIAVSIIAAPLGAAMAGAAANTAIVGSLTVGGLYAAGITMVGGMLINTLLPIKPVMPKYSDGDNSPTYAISGPKNTSSEEVVVPVVYGTMKLAGNRIATYTENVGDDQYLYMLINAGEGPIAAITDIQLNNQPIENFVDYLTQRRMGGASQEVIEWFNKSYAPYAKGIELDHINWVTHTTNGEIDEFRVDLVAPVGIGNYRDDGGVDTFTVPIDIEYRLVGSPGWTVLKDRNAVTTYITEYYYSDTDTTTTTLRSGSYVGGDGGTIFENGEDGWPIVVGHTNSVPVFEDDTKLAGRGRAQINKSFSSGALTQGQYEIRVKRRLEKLDLQKVVENVNVSEIVEIVSDTVAYNNTALLGIRVKASDQLNSVPNVTYLNHGRIIPVRRIQADGTPLWTSEPSANPAWVTYDILTNTRYGGGIDPARIDIDSLQEWADYCISEGLEFNGVFDTETNVWDGLQYVLRLGHAQLINIGTKYYFAVEKADDPVMMFNMGNIVERSFKITWLPMNSRSNEIEVTYWDRDADYERRTVKVRDPSIANTDAIKQARVVLYGCTSQQQAINEAVFQLNMNRLITKTVTFDAPVEAIACSVGSQILVQHDLPNWEWSGRLEAGSDQNVVQLDRTVELLEGRSYKLLLHYDKVQRAVGTVYSFSGGIVMLNGYDGNPNVTRIIINGVDHRIKRVVSNGSLYGVEIESQTGVVAGQSYSIFDTDVIEERFIADAPGETSSVTVSPSLASIPATYTKYMLGDVNYVKRPFRVTSINGSGHETRTIEAVEYNEAIYDFSNGIIITNPIIGEQIGQVRDLSAAQEYEQYGNIHMPIAELYWNLPATGVYGGADIYVSMNNGEFLKVGSTEAYGKSFRYAVPLSDVAVFRVVAFDIVGRRASISGAPAITFNPVAKGDVGIPTDLAVEPFGDGYRLTWANPLVNWDEILIYRSVTDDSGTATVVGRTRENSFVDNSALIGEVYYYWVRAITTDGTMGDFNAVNGVQANPPGQVQNLGLVSPFIADAVTIEWDDMDGAYDYEVQVEINGFTVRTVYTADTQYTYTHSMAAADGQVNRNITFRVAARMLDGTTGTSAEVIANNPQITAVPGNIVVNSAGNSYTVSWTHLGDVDLAGYQVHASQTPFFTPDGTNLVYDGPANGIEIPAAHGETWYIQIAGYDIWGKDSLTYSTEYTVFVENLQLTFEDISGEIQRSQLAQELASELDALSGSYTIKVAERSSDGTPYIAGIGISVEDTGGGPQEGAMTGQVLVKADRFAIIPSDPAAATAPTLPFVVDQGMVYINSAYINDGTITSAKIANIIESTNYTPTTGWRIDRAGAIEAAQITIRDSSGNVVLQSGGGITSDAVSGVNIDGALINGVDAGTRVGQAYANASQALTDAAAAQSTADGKIESFYQTTPPVSASDGDLWFDTDDGNRVYRWNGSAWVDAQDNQIASAISAAQTAQTTADGKALVFYSNAAPAEASEGDLWYDTDDALKRLYRRGAAAWEVVASYGADLGSNITGQITSLNASTIIANAAIGEAQIANAAITNAKISNVIQSNNWNETTKQGWKIDKAGYIQANAITIYDSSGNIVMSSGGTIDYSRLTNSPNSLSDINATEANTLSTAASDASNALSAAATAQSTADGKIDSYYQTSPPSGASAGDLWFETDNGYKQYRWSGSAWVSVQDTQIGTAITNAAGAQATADSKVRTFYQSSTPTATAAGDLWVHTGNSNQLYRWTGSSWANVRDTGISSALSAAATAQSTADGKIDTYYQTSAPSGASVGDLWFETDNGYKQYRYSGSAWVSVQDSGIGNAINAAATAQSTADGKITTFYQTSDPGVAAEAGDLWYDTDNANQIVYRRNSTDTGWNAISTYGATIGANVSGQISSSNVTTYIANLTVGTLQIAGNATFSEDADTGGPNTNENAWYNLCSATLSIPSESLAREVLLIGSINVEGTVLASGYSTGGGANISLEWRIFRGITTVIAGPYDFYKAYIPAQESFNTDWGANAGVLWTDTPSSGSQTYFLQVRCTTSPAAEVTVSTTGVFAATNLRK